MSGMGGGVTSASRRNAREIAKSMKDKPINQPLTLLQHPYLTASLEQQPPAQLIGCLSGGEWAVESIAGVDEERGLLFVTGAC